MKSTKLFSVVFLLLIGCTIAGCGDGPEGLSPTSSSCSPVCLEIVDSDNSQAIFRLAWNSEFAESIEGLDHFQLVGSYNSYGDTADSRILIDDISKTATQVSFDLPLHLFNPEANPTTGLTLSAIVSEGDVPNSTDALLSPEVTSSRALISYLKADDSNEGDHFGDASALSEDGSLLVVSAPEFDADESNQGAVYTFQRNEEFEWDSLEVLLPESPKNNGRFGEYLQLSDNKLVVAGADDSGAAIYIYKFEQDRWQRSDRITIPRGREIRSLALSGNGKRLAVGLSQNSASETVNVYEIESANHSLLKTKTLASECQGNCWFGRTLSFSYNGEILAVGAQKNGIRPSDLVFTQIPYGAAYIFREQGGDWALSAYLKGAKNSNYGQKFGSTVALSGNGQVLAVGAECESGSGSGLEAEPPSNPEITCSGAVYVYRDWVGSDDEPVFNGWEDYVKSHFAQENEYFGQSIQLSQDGNILVVSTQEADGSATGVWGSPQDQSKKDSGAAFMYLYASGQWNTGNYIKASNTDAGDGFGFSLALSSDGQTLAVGAPFEASNTDGVTGDGQDNNSLLGAGAVYVY